MQTRWLAVFHAHRNLMRIYGAVLNFLREEAGSNGKSATRAQEILLRMLDFKTMLAFRSIAFLLEILHKLSLDLQDSKITVAGAREAVFDAMFRLEREYDPASVMTGHIWMEFCNIHESIDETSTMSPLFWLEEEGELRSAHLLSFDEDCFCTLAISTSSSPLCRPARCANPALCHWLEDWPRAAP